MRVFVTVGSALQPFDRMLRAVDAALRECPAGAFEGVCQSGSSAVEPHGLRSTRTLARSAFDQEMMAADVVVTHAGVGSICTALRYGHVPVVFPRRARFGEVANDHQVDIARTFAEQGRVVVAEDAAAVATHLKRFMSGALARRQAGRTAGDLRPIEDALLAGPRLRAGSSIARALVRALAALAPMPELVRGERQARSAHAAAATGGGSVSGRMRMKT